MTIEEAKSELEHEVNTCRYAWDEPFGNSGSYRKLMRYLYTSVMSNGIGREEAKEWLFNLCEWQPDEAKEKFQDRVDVVISAIEHLKDCGKLR
jgi:hypothetical protein